jgi:diketogulonate reductase-like aldo/keto reductase
MRAIEKGVVTRADVFLQTKFTPLPGQDPTRVPYNALAHVEDQVRQSFAVSLTNLHTDYVDSLVLHSPMKHLEDTLAAWRVFEELHAMGQVRYLGISNIYSLELLTTIYNQATVKPTFVQNRFYKQSGFDVGIRAFCRDRGMKYQSFWTLTATPSFLRRYNSDHCLMFYISPFFFVLVYVLTALLDCLCSDSVLRAAEKYHRTPEQVMYQYMHHIGVIPLSGTKSVVHMDQDVDVFRVVSHPDGLTTLQVIFTPDEIESMTNFFVVFAAA